MGNRLKSRKFWVAVGSILGIVLVDILGMDIDRDSLIALVGIVASYLLGQSWVDAHNG